MFHLKNVIVGPLFSLLPTVFLVTEVPIAFRLLKKNKKLLTCSFMLIPNLSHPHSLSTRPDLVSMMLQAVDGDFVRLILSNNGTNSSDLLIKSFGDGL